ncbi:hypothetical protein HJC23_011670 [Cyclotella cryptica]|uniref:Reverse transcriptase domain-containing protein n=1 Tax=Cyclotella cryptica TaxID=29204 RepID=A0ABD3QIY7_9STRA
MNDKWDNRARHHKPLHRRSNNIQPTSLQRKSSYEAVFSLSCRGVGRCVLLDFLLDAALRERTPSVARWLVAESCAEAAKSRPLTVCVLSCPLRAAVAVRIVLYFILLYLILIVTKFLRCRVKDKIIASYLSRRNPTIGQSALATCLCCCFNSFTRDSKLDSETRLDVLFIFVGDAKRVFNQLKPLF